jgi:hypothetical protein
LLKKIKSVIVANVPQKKLQSIIQKPNSEENDKTQTETKQVRML